MTHWQTIILSLVSAIIGGAVVGFVFVFVGSNMGQLDDQSDSRFGAGAGYRMLEELQCQYGETKHIFMNGKDDNFTYGNLEPGKLSKRISHLPGHPANHPYRRAYDEVGMDKVLTDHFIVPPKVTGGIFVTRILPKSDYGNDYISLGDFKTQMDGYSYINISAFSSWLNDLSSQHGWELHGKGLYSARLKDIVFRFNDPETTKVKRKHHRLLEYLRHQKDESFVDILIADDTGVDFTGLAVCTAPEAPLGLTLANRAVITKFAPELQILTCDSDMLAYPCNPVYGDTLCTESLPLACFKDAALSVPELDKSVPANIRRDVNQFWSGGLINFTTPVRGDSFDTFHDANNFCAAEFGEGWRILNFHDGSQKNVVSPRTENAPESRFWIDIKDQPNGTCWSRDDAKILNQDGTAP